MTNIVAATQTNIVAATQTNIVAATQTNIVAATQTNIVAAVPQAVGFIQQIFSFLYHISPALVTVALGAFVIQRFFVSRANEASHIDRLIKELDELRNDALEYWTLDTKTTDKRDRVRVLEQKLKGNIKSLTSELQIYTNRYCTRGKLADFMIEVADACTGGQFETKNKAPDASRYILVVNSVNRVKFQLLGRKI